jgi:hypothetical protein
MSGFGDFSAHSDPRNSLKIQGVCLEFRLHLSVPSFWEIAVIVFALIAAILLLVGVSFISSIDFSDGRRR